MPAPNSSSTGLALLLQPLEALQRRRAARTQDLAGGGPQGGTTRASATFAPKTGRKTPSSDGARPASPTVAGPPAPAPPVPARPIPIPGAAEPEDYFSFQPAPPAAALAPGWAGPPRPTSPQQQVSPAAQSAGLPQADTPAPAPRPAPPVRTSGFCAVPSAPAANTQHTPGAVGDTKTGLNRATRPRRLNWRTRPAAVPPPLPPLEITVAQVRATAMAPLLAGLCAPEQVLGDARVAEVLEARDYLERLVEVAHNRACFRPLLYALDEALAAAASGVSGASLRLTFEGQGGGPNWSVVPQKTDMAGALLAYGPEAWRDAIKAGLASQFLASLHHSATIVGAGEAQLFVHEAVTVLGLTTHQLLLRVRAVVEGGIERLRPYRRQHGSAVQTTGDHLPHLGALQGLKRRLHRELEHLACGLREQHESLALREHALRGKLRHVEDSHHTGHWPPQRVACPVLAHRVVELTNGPQAQQLTTLYELVADVTVANLNEVQRAQDALRSIELTQQAAGPLSPRARSTQPYVAPPPASPAPT